MVAIFTGLGAGFERGSPAQIGVGGLLGSSSLGRASEGVFLNAATGNLVLSRRDEFLVGRGPDVAIARTYNSLGALDDNGDNILAALPDVMAQAIVGGFAGRFGASRDELRPHTRNSRAPAAAAPRASLAVDYYDPLDDGTRYFFDPRPDGGGGRRHWYEVALDWLGADGHFGTDYTRWGDFSWRGMSVAIRGHANRAVDDFTDSDVIEVWGRCEHVVPTRRSQRTRGGREPR